jgi:hypothetical protein
MREPPPSMKASTLILLVGSNPMPNYLTAYALRPATLALVYSDKTFSAMQRLSAALRSDLGERMKIRSSLLDDETSAAALNDVIRAIAEGIPPASLAINYTGGTKVMAAHALRAYSQVGGRDAAASYLHEGTEGLPPRLRFDDGTSLALSEFPHVPLTLSRLLDLHGAQYNERSAAGEGAPTPEDARSIFDAVLADVDLAQSLYHGTEGLRKTKSPKTVTEAFDPASLHLVLSVPRIPVAADMPKRTFGAWVSFLGGGWLEDIVAELIRSLQLPDAEVVVGVNANRGGKDVSLEVDVAVIRGHRSYFISCTTDTEKSINKSKLFEIVVRSQHLGGELARAALVCLAPAATIAALRKVIDDLWLSSNPTQVFGIEDLKEWVGFGGAAPHPQALADWLVS